MISEPHTPTDEIAKWKNFSGVMTLMHRRCCVGGRFDNVKAYGAQKYQFPLDFTAAKFELNGDSVWRHLTMVFDEESDNVRYYMDGVKAWEGAWLSKVRNADCNGGNKTVTLGRSWPGYTYGQPVEIYDWRMYVHGTGGPLSDGEVKAISEQPTPALAEDAMCLPITSDQVRSFCVSLVVRGLRVLVWGLCALLRMCSSDKCACWLVPQSTIRTTKCFSCACSDVDLEHVVPCISRPNVLTFSSFLWHICMGPQMVDTEWKDAFGHACDFFHDRKSEGHAVCSYPGATEHCPIACQGKQVGFVFESLRGPSAKVCCFGMFCSALGLES